MFTKHTVEFKFSTDEDSLRKHFNEMLKIINWQLNQLGTAYDLLSEDRKFVVNSSLGGISGNIPMLCFTEVAEGKDISSHGNMFGNYGLVVSRRWLEYNGGDRVVYVGDDAVFGTLLARIISSFKILTLRKNDAGLVLFEGHFTEMILGLFCYIEKRTHIEQQEWRIAGKHGFLGGGNSDGEYLPITLNDIEYIFAQNSDEVEKLKVIVKEKIKLENYTGNIPKIMIYPSCIPM